jgi:hypothetical protein
MAQIAGIEIDQAEDIASGIAPRGKIRILLDLRDRLLPRASIKQGKGFPDRGLEKRPAAKLIAVIETIQWFNLGGSHLPVLIRRDIEPEPHGIQWVIRYRREKSKAVEASGATITMTCPTKRWTQIEAKKTFAGLTRARRPLSKSAMIPRRHGWLHSSCFNAA